MTRPTNHLSGQPEPTESTQHPQRRSHPFAMSLVTHTLLIVAIFVTWTVSRRPDPPGEQLRRADIVLAVAQDDTIPRYLTQKDLSKPLPKDHESPVSHEAIDSPSNAAPPPVPIAAQPLLDPTSDLRGQVPIAGLISDASNMSNVPTKSNKSSQYQLSPEDLKLIESDQKLLEARRPVGEPASLSLFGSGQLTGRDFVFVLDRSQSMGSGGLGVIQASRTQLSHAISQLEPHHHFQVVAYHNHTVTISTRKLLPATNANKQKVAPFIGSLAAFGGTHHEHGLLAAIAFHPDVIVLMTDGGLPELHDGQLKMIQRLAGNGSGIKANGSTQIHCIQFGAGPQKSKTSFIARLAEQNQGSFRYIDVNQWNP